MGESTTITIGLAITALTVVGGGAWWASALYAQVRGINRMLKHVTVWMTSELGGVHEDGRMLEGNQNRLRRELRTELSERIRKLEGA